MNYISVQSLLPLRKGEIAWSQAPSHPSTNKPWSFQVIDLACPMLVSWEGVRGYPPHPPTLRPREGYLPPFPLRGCFLCIPIRST